MSQPKIFGARNISAVGLFAHTFLTHNFRTCGVIEPPGATATKQSFLSLTSAGTFFRFLNIIPSIAFCWLSKPHNTTEYRFCHAPGFADYIIGAFWLLVFFVTMLHHIGVSSIKTILCLKPPAQMHIFGGIFSLKEEFRWKQQLSCAQSLLSPNRFVQCHVAN